MHATTAKGEVTEASSERRHMGGGGYNCKAIRGAPQVVLHAFIGKCTTEEQVARTTAQATPGVHSCSHLVTLQCSGSHLVRDIGLSSFALASSFVEQVQL